MRGMTEAKMRTAMNIEAIGSNPVQPYLLIRRVETITPQEPRVSAMTCYVGQRDSQTLQVNVSIMTLTRNTPCIL